MATFNSFCFSSDTSDSSTSAGPTALSSGTRERLGNPFLVRGFPDKFMLFFFFEIVLWGLFALASWLCFAQGARLFVLLSTAVGAV